MNEKKVAAVASLEQEMSSADFLVFFSHRGISGAEITRFRRELKKSGGRMRMVKNTLLDIAMDRSGLGSLQEMVSGPSGLVSYRGEDEIQILKTISAFSRETQERLVIRGGCQNGIPVTAEQISSAARIPGREYVLAHFCGMMASPLLSFLLTLKAVPRSLVSVLAQVGEQKKTDGEK